MTATSDAADRSTVCDEPGMGLVEVFALPVDEATLFSVLRDAFEKYWPSIRFGVLIQGAVFEIRATAPPRLGLRDGYITVDLGDSHFHVCIGPHRGEPGHPVSRKLAEHRRCHRAELYRVLHESGPVSWGPAHVQRRGGATAHDHAAEPLSRRRSTGSDRTRLVAARLLGRAAGDLPPPRT